VAQVGIGASQQTTSGAPVVIQNADNYTWAATVLTDAGLPATPNNVLNVTRWMVSEEPAASWFNNNNPLNINAGGTGSDTFPSLTASAQETARYLNMPNYTGIKAALASNADFPTFMNAVVASPWASGHYNGGASFFTGTPAKVQAGTGITLTPGSGGTAANTTGGTTCGSKGGGADLLGLHIGTACQLKALTGGLLVGLGASVIIIGVFVLARQTTFGKNVTNTAATALGPVGKVYNTASNAIENRRFAAAEVRGRENQAFYEREITRRGGAVPRGSRAPRTAEGLDF